MRPSSDENYIEQARVVARRATCSRRQVGCILVDRHKQVLATGYNGPASGEDHCTEKPCAGANLASGTGLSVCEAIHAEANALLQCRDKFAIETAYVTTPPCRDCVKLLMNTGCRRIVFIGDYPQMEEARELWQRNNTYSRYPGHSVDLDIGGKNREWICLG